MDTSDQNIRVWDWPLRLFHWLLVTAIAVAFLSSEEDSILNQWHVLAGWVAALLILFRLVWGFLGGEHSRFSDFVHPSQLLHHLRDLGQRRVEPSLGHNPLGGIAVLLLLGLTAITVWTGAFGGEAAEELHEIIAWTLLAMVVVHIIAVVTMSLLLRENLIRAMVTGTKPRVRHPTASDATPPRPIGAIVTLVVLGLSLFGVLRYDPDAFRLRTSEAFEHRGAAADASYADERDEHDED
jgi:cytochrome b